MAGRAARERFNPGPWIVGRTTEEHCRGIAYREPIIYDIVLLMMIKNCQFISVFILTLLMDVRLKV